MAYKREIKANVDNLLKILKDGNISKEDSEKASKALDEYGKVGPIIKELEFHKLEHGFWECPVCRKISNDTSAELDICPFCEHKLTTEEVVNQKSRMKRIKKVYR